ncbi:MAG: AbrB/MazE/SpoVT family DNA-binding domain-containing protein, partial [Limisphaerales bacterium]
RKPSKTFGMSTATLSTKGQLVIPNRFRKALHLRPGDKVSFTLEGEKLVMQRDERRHAKLVEKKGRKVLVAPPGAPPMTTEVVKALLADFP